MLSRKQYEIVCDAVENSIFGQPVGGKGVVLYPYGQNGIEIENVLRNRYAVSDIVHVDDGLCRFRSDIFNSRDLSTVSLGRVVFVTVDYKNAIYDEIVKRANNYVKQDLIILFKPDEKINRYATHIKTTAIGKYSGGEGINNLDGTFIKSIGAFTSIAKGFSVVPNHPLKYISTHSFLYGANREGEKEYCGNIKYEDFSDERWFFSGIEPIGTNYVKRVNIGNDVWIGANVTITNFADVGDGAVIGAGAVVTKDVPDYAIVAGVPARVIRYRYDKEQVDALKKIAWWHWDDKKIREHYLDFFCHVDEFIRKNG